MKEYKSIKECSKDLKEIKANEEIKIEKEFNIGDPSVNFVVVVLLNKGSIIINNGFKIYKKESRLLDYIIYESLEGNKNYIRQVLKREN